MHASSEVLLDGRAHLLDIKPTALRSFHLVELWITLQIARLRAGDVSVKRLPYQLTMVRYWSTMVITGDGGSGFDSGEGA